jgi:hypothetical protein
MLPHGVDRFASGVRLLALRWVSTAPLMPGFHFSLVASTPRFESDCRDEALARHRMTVISIRRSCFEFFLKERERQRSSGPSYGGSKASWRIPRLSFRSLFVETMAISWSGPLFQARGISITAH